MFLVQNSSYIIRINSISTFACQAFGAVLNPSSYTKILAAKAFTKVLGYIPAKKLGLGPFNESYYTMTQWYDWNLQKNFKSSFIKIKTSINSLSLQMSVLIIAKAWQTLRRSIYAISGKGDRFISPTQGCQLFFDKFANTDNVFIEYAKTSGHLEDYDHTRILMSRNAAAEISPTVASWIEKYSH